MAGKPRILINFDKIYQSNSSGPFKIIEDLGRDNKSRLYVRIQFLETGVIKDIRYDLAMDGKALDDLYGIDFNKVYNSIYYGPYMIIKYIGRNNESKRVVRIKFLNTGYEYNVLLRCALNSTVKDKTVDYHDRKFDDEVLSIEEHDKFIKTILYSRWKAMMRRCYSPNDEKYKAYGAVGVTVSEFWKSFGNYLATVPLLRNYSKFYHNPDIYHIDKDYLQRNIPTSQRIYSPETCIFLSVFDNSNLSMLENHIDGEYYGVREIENGKYEVVFSINGVKTYFGVYSNIIAAANEYNYYYLLFSKFELIPLLNNVEYMPHDESQKYLVNNLQV